MIQINATTTFLNLTSKGNKKNRETTKNVTRFEFLPIDFIDRSLIKKNTTIAKGDKFLCFVSHSIPYPKNCRVEFNMYQDLLSHRILFFTWSYYIVNNSRAIKFSTNRMKKKKSIKTNIELLATWPMERKFYVHKHTYMHTEHYHLIRDFISIDCLTFKTLSLPKQTHITIKKSCFLSSDERTRIIFHLICTSNENQDN